MLRSWLRGPKQCLTSVTKQVHSDNNADILDILDVLGHFGTFWDILRQFGRFYYEFGALRLSKTPSHF